MFTLRTVAALSVAVLAAAGCSTNPVSGESEFMLISEEQEIAVGQEAAPEIVKELGGELPDERVQAYVSEMGMKIAKASARPDLPWSFTVVNSDEPNAMALPGGPVFVTRGLLLIMGSEAELAGVLGHEIGHTAARHQAQQMSTSAAFQTLLGIGGAVAGEGVGGQAATTGAAIAGQLLLLRYSREDELEADEISIDSVPQVGWDPLGLVSSFEALMRATEAQGAGEAPTFLQTHPTTEERIERARARIRKKYSEAQLARLRRDSEEFDAIVAAVRATPAPAAPREVPAGTGGRETEPPADDR